jgi:MarR family transcriptional regulator, temperature-dependent positive regulator of motility
VKAEINPEDTRGALALVTMLSKSVYSTVAERDGSSFKLKQVIALSYLRELGSVGQKYFGSVLCLDANNTVLLLNDLERDGLVVRQRDPDDRRRHLIELTETGFEVLREAEMAMAEIEDSLLAALDEDQRQQFRALLHQALYGQDGVFERRTAAAVWS